MHKVTVFLAILIASLASLIAVTVAGFYLFTVAYQNPYSWMSGMTGGMGGMMGQNGTTQAAAQNAAVPYFGALFVVLIGVCIVGIAGVAYFLLFPEIKTRAITTTLQPPAQNVAEQSTPTSTAPITPVTPYASVMKTLTDEERRVVEVLAAHDGKYLQKYIRKETGLSRLKTHRIVARLAERGIVTLEKTGNTNTVFLSDWLKK
jgi:predicted transcriptional regulator